MPRWISPRRLRKYTVMLVCWFLMGLLLVVNWLIDWTERVHPLKDDDG